ncbi:MAG: hypothetical protein V4687_16935 [Bacteroidota bacterium]
MKALTPVTAALYLTFTWFFTALILSNYTKLMYGLLPAGNHYREYFICGGQILFQGMVITIINKQKSILYLCNMMTISFLGAILLLPAVLFPISQTSNPIFYLGWFMAVAGLMFLAHIIRSRKLQIGWKLTGTWVLYRIAVLLLILLNP